MDRSTKYRAIIKRILEEYNDFFTMPASIQPQLVFDEQRDHYFVYQTGWDGYRRIHGTPIHIDIINGKVWIQHDGTKDGIADELLEAGIPKEDIVLGFHSPEIRALGEFAVA